MLGDEPFYLSQPLATEFMKACLPQQEWDRSTISGEVLLSNLRRVIEDFELLNEKNEEQMLYRIADFMTMHRSALEKELERVGRNGRVSKA
jgi:hypothetical protein